MYTYSLTLSPPQKLKAGYLSVDVDAFIPNLLCCFKCQKDGHGKDSCKNEVTCFRWTQVGHDNTDCQNQAKCANCLGPHIAVLKVCPVWINEENIQRIKTKKT